MKRLPHRDPCMICGCEAKLELVVEAGWIFACERCAKDFYARFERAEAAAEGER